MEIKNIIEGALFAAGEAVSLQRLQKLFGEDNPPSTAEITAAIEALQQDYLDRAIELREVASGYRVQVKADVAAWVANLWEERAPRYSRAFLETLAIIVYRQPVTRAQIEDIRGVAVSSNIIKTLEEREWVRVVGHREVPGRPALYATTRQFLDEFNLKNLDELPTLKDLMEFEAVEKLLQKEIDFAANDAVELPVAEPAEAVEVAEVVKAVNSTERVEEEDETALETV